MTRHVCPMITARPNDRSGLVPLMSRFAILAKDKNQEQISRNVSTSLENSEPAQLPQLSALAK
jgi:hypothetical protein